MASIPSSTYLAPDTGKGVEAEGTVRRQGERRGLELNRPVKVTICCCVIAARATNSPPPRPGAEWGGLCPGPQTAKAESSDIFSVWEGIARAARGAPGAQGHVVLLSGRKKNAAGSRTPFETQHVGCDGRPCNERYG